MPSTSPSPFLHDVLIIGGSYAGLSAALALGRSLRRVLVIDGGAPCNRTAPASHNFLTHDGTPPAAIARAARAQLAHYPHVELMSGQVAEVSGADGHFMALTNDGRRLAARKVLLATGVTDLLPELPGFADCWGISVLHCPYCHGYEVHGLPLGVRGNGDLGFEFARLVRNWSGALTLFTDGPSTLSAGRQAALGTAGVRIEEVPLARIVHTAGQVAAIALADGRDIPVAALFARVPFALNGLTAALGCALTPTGHVAVDEMSRTSIPGVYAAGDLTTPLRSVAAAVGSGNRAGAFINHALIAEELPG
ncbi:MAG: NAD(P)/FAD-dependent oxidoreductase [Bacteroidetes bacterium]|nr:NAD(P)/FAD-dependent oxidoreductase [Bacteroidota bacterium]